MRFGFEGGVMEEAPLITEENECLNLPPGFRFHPTDEEIITYYLCNKVLNNSFRAKAIGEVDLNNCEPWDLPNKAKMGEKGWYFFCQRDRKYPTGMRTNRATQAGYWKATGKDKEIYKGKGCLVGMKKTLVFYKGRAPKGEKSNWVMHEFRLDGKFSHYNLPKAPKKEWVVCKVFHKTTGIKRSLVSDLSRMDGVDLLESPSLPPLFDSPCSNTNQRNVQESWGGNYKRTVTATGISDGISMHHLSTNMEDQQDYSSPPSSILFPCGSFSNLPLSIPGSANLHHVWKNSMPNFTSYGCGVPDMVMLGCLATNDAVSGLKRQCNLEQFSEQSMVSQDPWLNSIGGFRG